jgi:hypothetical protein
MFQTEDDLFHRESTFANDPRGVEQHQATYQAPEGFDTVDLQEAKALLEALT